MNIAVESYGHSVVLNLKGELTEDTLATVSQTIDHQLLEEDVVDVVLNMENVPFVDSNVLEYLLGLQDRLLERMGQVKLLRCDENVRKILEITRLESSFEMFKETHEAVKTI
jgi:anti-sigma B factor antagonist